MIFSGLTSGCIKPSFSAFVITRLSSDSLVSRSLVSVCSASSLTLSAEVVYFVYFFISAVAHVNTDQRQKAEPTCERQEFYNGFICDFQTIPKSAKKDFDLIHLYSILYEFVQLP